MNEQQNRNKFDENIIEFLETIKTEINSVNRTNFNELKIFISLLPEAMKYKLVPILYESNTKFRKNNLSVKKKIGNRLLNIKQKLNYTFWFILFKIKWWLFSDKIIKKKKIIANVGCERKISQFYLEVVNEIAADNETIVISFNILCSFKYLFNKTYFYYHSFNFVATMDKVILKKLGALIYSKLCKFDEYFYNKHYFKKNISSNIIFLNREFQKCQKFLKKYNNTIVGLVQDYDYSYNKYIYVELFKKYKIQTISLQHSISFYNHLYKNIFSDFYLVWGKQELERVKDNNEFTKVEIVGYAIGKNMSEIEDIEIEKKYVIFFLASHDYATSQSDNRQLEYVNSILQQIKTNLMVIDPRIEYVVIPHPHDRKELYDSSINWESKKINFEILKKTKLLIFEDTTAIFDYLLKPIPILYICDEKNNDPLKIKKYNSISTYFNGNDMKETLINSFNSKVELNKRKEHLAYFYNFTTKSNYYNMIKKRLYN